MSKGKHNKNNIKKIFLILELILILIIIIGLSIIVYLELNRYKNNKDNAELKEFMASPIIDNRVETILENDVEDIEIPVNIKTDRMIKLEELQKENSDIVGWLEIIDSDISYPVLQGEDNSYYMTHNYKKEYSREGSLFLDTDYDWSLPSTNLLIYGHNNRGTNVMFCGLMNYKNENYYNTHKKIRFTTKDEDSEFEIISVFLSRVYYQYEQNVFKYYYFINANSKEEFDEYIENSKKASLYDIEITAEYGEQLLTLSTCEFSKKDGRLAIVAKKVKIYN